MIVLIWWYLYYSARRLKHGWLLKMGQPELEWRWRWCKFYLERTHVRMNERTIAFSFVCNTITTPNPSNILHQHLETSSYQHQHQHQHNTPTHKNTQQHTTTRTITRKHKQTHKNTWNRTKTRNNAQKHIQKHRNHTNPNCRLWRPVSSSSCVNVKLGRVVGPSPPRKLREPSQAKE